MSIEHDVGYNIGERWAKMDTYAISYGNFSAYISKNLAGLTDPRAG